MNIFNLFITLLSLASCSSSRSTLYQKKAYLYSNKTNVKIAILLPEKWPNSNNLSQMAIYGLQQAGLKNIQIAQYDLNQGINNAVSQILAQETDIILGPIFSNDTKKVANLVQNIPVISLSNDLPIASNNIYIFGHNPLQQTNRLIEYLARREVKNFILLLPGNRKTMDLAKIVTDILVRKGLSLINIEFYPRSLQSIQQTVEKISNVVDDLNDDAENISKTAIYISDEPENLTLIFNALKKHNLDQKAIICGEQKIDITYSEPINLTFTGSIKHFKSNILPPELQNIHLSFWDKMAFDLGLITAHAIGHKPFKPQNFLANLDLNYIGIGGNIRFFNQTAVRKYDIVQRLGNNYKTLEEDKEKL